MAKKNGSVFNKILNMIGIVDAEQEPQYRVYETPYGGRQQNGYAQRPAQQPQQPYQQPRSRNGYQPYGENRRSYNGGLSNANTSRYGRNPGYGAAQRTARPNTGYRPAQGTREDDVVVPFAQNVRPESPKTVIYYLNRLDECTSVITDLISGKTVLVNLENLEAPGLQRAVDTLSGAAFAISATMQKASDRAYLISPTKVEIGSGEARRPSYTR